MKISPFILCLILLSCGAPKTEIPQDILSKEVFESILKKIHLAEGAYELNKIKNIENAKSTLKKNHTSIYSEYKISSIDFENTLNYYAQNPEKLEEIYNSILEQFIEERSILDQQ